MERLKLSKKFIVIMVLQFIAVHLLSQSEMKIKGVYLFSDTVSYTADHSIEKQYYLSLFNVLSDDICDDFIVVESPNIDSLIPWKTYILNIRSSFNEKKKESKLIKEITDLPRVSMGRRKLIEGNKKRFYLLKAKCIN